MFDKQAVHRAKRTGYVSEFEQFIDTFLDEHPEVVRDQRKGWYIFWNHKADLEELEKASKDSAPVKGYDYF